jgi:hypothetical protein
MAGFGVTRRAAAAVAVGFAMALAATACGGGGSAQTSSSSRSGAGAVAAATPRRELARRYLAIAESGNRRLEHDFDPLGDRDRNNLARARADLADAAATERLFDRRLLAIQFAPATERVARDLYRVNQMRATLTAAAAAATSLRLLHSYDPVLDAANVPVERDVAAIRRALGLPPPDSS